VSLAINAVVAGLAIGSVYGLVALGYTVVFNATRVFNLAQGDLVMLGVLLSWYLLDVRHWPQVAALACVLVGVTAVSLAEERLVVRPFLSRPRDNIGWFIATLAFSLVVETVVTDLYGENPPQPVPSPLPSRAIHLGSVSIVPKLLLAFLALVAVTAAVEAFYRRTWLGTAMRATAEDREVAALRGISPTRMSALAFGIGGLVAAVAGYVVAPIVFSDVTIGLNYSLKGFIALAIGGFGSIRGALVGAWVLGVGEQLFDLYVSPRYEVVAGLALLMAVLAVRPTGLFGPGRLRRV
jgi:branched-chain amino acid transport system permease protein